MELRHTYLQGPWHLCGVCDDRAKVADMTWQRGVLKCKKCFDKGFLLGEREAAIALVLEDGKEELAPVEKLREPDTNEANDDFVL